METNTKLKTVKDLRELTGVTRKQLHKFHKEGLLEPTRLQNEAGYKLYDESAIDKLWQILIFIEIGTPLRDIKKILNGNTYDRNTIIQLQIDELNKKKDRIEEMISIAEILQLTGTEESLLNKAIFEKRGQFKKQLSERQGLDEYNEYSKEIENTMEEFNEGLEPLIDNLALLEGQGVESEKFTNAIIEIESFARKFKFGRLLLWLMVTSLIGRGDVYISWLEKYGEGTLEYVIQCLSQLMLASLNSTINAYTDKFDKAKYGKSIKEAKIEYIRGLKKEFEEFIPFFTEAEFYELFKNVLAVYFEPDQKEFALDALETYYFGGE